MKHLYQLIRRRCSLVVIFCMCLLSPFTIQAETSKDNQPARILYILDASGSMWGQIDGKSKIEIAKKTLSNLLTSQPDNSAIGIMAYGHRRKADCSDIELISPIQTGSQARNRQLEIIQSISPKGKTPLAQSVTQAIDQVSALPGQSTVILISDGKESCHLDPCAAVKAASDNGVAFVLHTIGFAVDEEAASQLSCMANAGHGQYFQADNAEQLSQYASKATESGAAAQLTIIATNNGQPIKTRIYMHPSDSDTAAILTADEGVDSGVQYSVAAGEYLLEVTPANAMGVPPQIRKVSIDSGIDKTESFDFSMQEWSFGATDNGTSTRFKIQVVKTLDNSLVFDSDTFSTMTMNGVESPYALKLPRGKYKLIARLADGTIGVSERILDTDNAPEKNIKFDFETGRISINVIQNGQSVVANALIFAENTKDPLYSTPPYVGEQTPINLKLLSGNYRIQAWPVALDNPGREANKSISIGPSDSQSIIFNYDDEGTLTDNGEKVGENNKSFEMDTDRPGLDYKNFLLPDSDPELCYQACEADNNCKAWTYIKPHTLQGPEPVCWLKNAIPNASKNNCCISGLSQH